jgi:hypothetical protein
MKTQIIKKPEVMYWDIEYKTGQEITFVYEVPLQNIGWTLERKTGIIQKVNRMTVHALDNEGNLWKVHKYDIRN